MLELAASAIYVVAGLCCWSEVASATCHISADYVPHYVHSAVNSQLKFNFGEKIYNVMILLYIRSQAYEEHNQLKCDRWH